MLTLGCLLFSSKNQFSNFCYREDKISGILSDSETAKLPVSVTIPKVDMCCKLWLYVLSSPKGNRLFSMEYFHLNSISTKVLIFDFLLSRMLYHFMFALFCHRIGFKRFDLNKTTYFLIMIHIRVCWFANCITNVWLFLIANYKFMKIWRIKSPCMFRGATRNFVGPGFPKSLTQSTTRRKVFPEMTANWAI